MRHCISTLPESDQGKAARKAAFQNPNLTIVLYQAVINAVFACLR
jgi:hypothetical protein